MKTMYHQIYATAAGESQRVARNREKSALLRAVEMLEAAKKSKPGSPATAQATDFVRQLWTVFLRDLTNEDNALPPKLKASLISIALQVKKEADHVDAGQAASLDKLIEINRIIADGLD